MIVRLLDPPQAESLPSRPAGGSPTGDRPLGRPGPGITRAAALRLAFLPAWPDNPTSTGSEAANPTTPLPRAGSDAPTDSLPKQDGMHALTRGVALTPDEPSTVVQAMVVVGRPATPGPRGRTVEVARERTLEPLADDPNPTGAGLIGEIGPLDSRSLETPLFGLLDRLRLPEASVPRPGNPASLMLLLAGLLTFEAAYRWRRWSYRPRAGIAAGNSGTRRVVL